MNGLKIRYWSTVRRYTQLLLPKRSSFYFFGAERKRLRMPLTITFLNEENEALTNESIPNLFKYK